MTSQFLLDRTRALLNDAGRGTSTNARFYTDDSIQRALNTAQEQILKAMISAPHPPMLALRSLVTVTDVITTPAALAGVWKLICGQISSNSKYVPRVVATIGQAFIKKIDNTQSDQIYVMDGIVYGTANLVYYYTTPTSIDRAISADLPMSTGFYDAVKFLAARDIVAQEDKDAADRWKFFNDIAIQKMKSIT